MDSTTTTAHLHHTLLSTSTMYVRRGLLHSTLQNNANDATNTTTTIADGDGIHIEGSSSRGLIGQRLGLFIFLFAFVFALAIILFMIIREYYWRKYGMDVCVCLRSTGTNNGTTNSGQSRPRTPRHLRRQVHQDQTNQNNQIQSDEELAQELQRQLNEETREQDRLEKRKERREWYVFFIKPYTMEAQEKDFFYAKETTTSTTEPTTITDTSSADFSSNCSTDSAEDDDEDSNNGDDGFSSSEEELSSAKMEKIKASSSAPTRKNTDATATSTSTSCSESSVSSSTAAEPQSTSTTCCELESHYSIRLPVNCLKHIGDKRTVDAHCAICLGVYEAGEKIVWSSLPQCQHAFHDECILPWLSKGKKRCPICRHWFVPGTKIDDQKAALEITTTTATNDDDDNSENGATATRERSFTASTDENEEYDHEMEDIDIAVVNAAIPAIEPESSLAPEMTTRTTAAADEVDDNRQPNTAWEQQHQQVGNRSQDDEGEQQPPDIENGLPPNLSAHQTL